MGTVNTLGPSVNIEYDSTGSLAVKEQFAPVAEDNTNGVIGVMIKPIVSSAYSYTNYQNNSFTTVNVKATIGNLFSFTVHNTTASTRYIQFHGTATTPAGGATATWKHVVPANSCVDIGKDIFGEAGMNFPLGFAIANSSTLTTYTAGSAGDLVIDLNYR